MADITSLTAQPLEPSRSFNWIFLVELLVCGILTLFFLFYFNRLFATLVSYGFRAYTWHRFRVYVDVQALQISLLGGRIFFKGVRYHGLNETILIQHGYVTWNYWFQAVKQADCARSANNVSHRSAGSTEEVRNVSVSGSEPGAKESGAFKAAKDFPSRISVSVSGLEWFIYNRSSAYEAITASQALKSRQHVARPTSSDPHKPAASDLSDKRADQRNGIHAQQPKQSLNDTLTNSTSAGPSVCAVTETGGSSRSSHQNHVIETKLSLPQLEAKGTNSSAAESGHDYDAAASPLILTFLPILIECQKGAIVIGNENTRTILTTRFERFRGHIDAATSSPRDIYRQIFELEVTHPVSQMRPNPDYRQPQQGAAQDVAHNTALVHDKRSRWGTNWDFRNRRRRAMHNIRNFMPYWLSSVESFRPSSVQDKSNLGQGIRTDEIPGESRWLGLSRYLDENERDDHQGWSNVEYARFSSLVDCPSVHINLYWDEPGPVKPDPDSVNMSEGHQDINLAKPPAYGLDLVVRGGNFNYGPWADRARAEIQSVFFPNPYQDAVPANPLPVGAPRQSTILKINVHIDDEATLRIPTREHSKDFQWKGRAGALRGASGAKQYRDRKHTRKRKQEKNLLGPDIRPFGWFAISVSPNSTLTYTMDMIARKQGYLNDLELDLKGTRMTTSVNHALLWSCGQQKISCDLSNPLGWNAFHTWKFNVQSHDMELFLLRDHIFLLVDLIGDFTSGPAGDFLTFVPFLYQLELSFTNVKLYLNANDSNIIDNPCEVGENTFLMLHGETLDANIEIPLEDYAPSENRVSFRAKARDARLDIATPTWNTAHTFASDLPTATLEDFSMDGSYNYYSNAANNLTDSLFLNLSGSSPRIYLQGTLIRYCMKLKDNYFGDDVHFRTLEEYQDLLFKQNDSNSEPVHFQNKKDNNLDVVLNITFDRVCVLLPANIYSRKENLRLDFLLIEADVRFTNYYMDLEAKFSPVEAAWESIKAEEAGMEDYVSKTQGFLDGIRVYGHRLFGSPPSEPTYLCNWDFDIGKVTGECSTDFIRTFLQAIRSFTFTFDDEENALPESHVPVIHDVTFLRAKFDSVKLWFMLEETAILLGAERIDIRFNDWVAQSFSERLCLEILDIQLAAVDQKTAIRHKSPDSPPVPTHGVLQMSLFLKMVQRKRDFAQKKELQQQHIRLHDQQTYRGSWLLHGSSQESENRRQPPRARPNPPSMPVPHMPAPLRRQNDTRESRISTEVPNRKYTSSSKPRHKHSFMTQASTPSESSSRSNKTSPSVVFYGANQLSTQQFLYSAAPASIEKYGEFFTLPKTGFGRDGLDEGKKVRRRLTSAIIYSSPWTSPYFPLQNIVLDTRNTPDKPLESKVAEENKILQHNALEAFEQLYNNRITGHTLLDVDVDSSMCGFATPIVFSAVAALLNALMPERPTDLLDDLQVGTTSRILKCATIHQELGQAADFCIRFPFVHLRILNSDSLWQAPSDNDIRDQYDLQVVKAELTARSSTKKKPSNSQPAVQNDLYLRFVIQKGLLEVHDRASDVLYDKAAARISLQDIVMWMASDERTVAKYRQRELEMTTWSSRFDYLALLLHRTVDLSEFLLGQFVNMSSAIRVQRVVYKLTDIADGFTDPAFLTRPSYVLRTAEDHLRLNDSWKIVSRLRHILQSLDSSQRAILLQEVSNASLPSDAEAQVLAKFDNWRSWDLAHVRKSLIMEMIWRPTEVTRNAKPGDQEYLLELSFRRAKLLVDPGPKENQIGTHDVNIAFSTTLGPKHGPSRTTDDNLLSRTITVQSYCSRFGIHLNWELVELINQVKLVISKHEEARSVPVKLVKEERRQVSPYRLHVAVGWDSGVVTLNSINVTVVMAASGLRGSILHQVEDGGTGTSSIVLTSRSASARLKDMKKVVLGCFLENSALSLSQTTTVPQNADLDIFKAAGKCELLQFEMKEDIVSSLDVVNRIIRDEVDTLTSLVLRPRTNSGSVQEKQQLDSERQHDVYIALFLDQYVLSVAIVPSLTYVISGNIARTSVVPRSPSNMVINFDLKQNSHAFKLKDKARSSQEAVLHIPPINGRLVCSRNKERTKIEIDMILDKVNLDARSVRACVDILNNAEVIRALTNAKRSAQQASSQLNTVSSSRPATAAQPPDLSMTLLYSAVVTFVGLRVHASAPALKSKDSRAELDFVLGLTTVRLKNQGKQERMVLDRPQFDIDFGCISLNIYRRSLSDLIKYGNLEFRGQVVGKTGIDDKKNQTRMYHAASGSLDINIHPETACLVVDIAAHLQERIKSLTLSREIRQLRPLRRLTTTGFTEAPMVAVTTDESSKEESESDSNLFDSIYSVELNAIKIAWRLDTHTATMPYKETEDLIFSVRKVSLSTKRDGSATLAIADLQLQLAPKSLETHRRSLNSALMSEIVFKAAYLSTKKDRRLAFQAAGKALDLRLASDIIVPVTALRASLAAASTELREGSALWAARPVSNKKDTTSLFGSKHLASLLIDADFAGAVVSIQARKSDEEGKTVFGIPKGDRRSRTGRYNQVVQGGSAAQATLRAPGVAMKIEYSDSRRDDPALNAEIKVAASSNVLYPSVVPLMIEISSSIKEIVGSPDDISKKSTTRRKSEAQKSLPNPSVVSSNPANLMGRCQLNLGLWIKEQDFSLSCQPIARVAATARVNDIFMAVNTVQSPEQERFFALSVTFNNLQASVQHVYSHQSTASFDVDSVILSMMNSKHVSNATGISAILNVSPIRSSINAKQLQDFLLFREIWYPAELRQASSTSATASAAVDSQAYVVQRYQQVAAAGALPWNAVVSVQELMVQLDLGQSLGKSVFTISQLWASSKKASDSEQNLCVGFDKVSIESTGRMSGFVELQNFRVRTSIRWPRMNPSVEQTPLVQASLGFDQFRVKVAFDYQPFAISDVSEFEFFMYNIRPSQRDEKDRLVGVLEGEKVQLFCTTATASQALALHQAVVRLIEEKEVAYKASLRELDKYLRRKSLFASSNWASASTELSAENKPNIKEPSSLRTDVFVNLRAVNAGAFPSMFLDNQIFKVEATDAQARFAVNAEEHKTHSSLGLTLGQLRVALSNVNRANTEALGEVSIGDIVSRATNSRGGTILKVPKVVAIMETWQSASSTSIDYIFKSTFEGKVDVGWNYSRISFIRGMWSTHARALASRLGKPLPQSAVQITGGPQPDEKGEGRGQEKITAVVNVPQSRFEYRALEPPIIETPQLRDMGEATPPLEWIGLHRDKLPNVTHQIIIVTLLGIAKEVEDAYSKILGSSP